MKENDSFFSEFSRPLNKIKRAWFRRLITFLLIPMTLPAFLACGVIEALTEFDDFFKKCWNGKDL